MKKRIPALMVVLAMVISIMPMSIATVSAAATNIASGRKFAYSSINSWGEGSYTTIASSYNADAEYTIDVAASSSKQAFRINDLPIEANSTYVLSVKVQDVGNTDNTLKDVTFHNGHSCLAASTTTLGATSIGTNLTELKYAISFGVGTGASATQCSTHGNIKVLGQTTGKTAIIHAGIYFKSAQADKLLVKDFSFVKVGNISVDASMSETTNVGTTAEITYTFSSAPVSAPTKSNVTISGGAGEVSNVERGSSDTEYKVSLAGLERNKSYTVTLKDVPEEILGKFPEKSITFTTVGYISDPNVYAYETFDYDTVGEASSLFTGGNQVVQLKSGSTTDKVVALSTPTTGTNRINFGLNKAITAASGVIEFSFDLFRQNNTDKTFKFYIANGNVISGSFKINTLTTYPDQGSLGTPASNAWNHIAIRVDVKNQIYTVLVNDVVTCDEAGMAKEFDFRKATTSISNGFMELDADPVTRTVLIDNFKVQKVEGNESLIKSFDFEGTSTGFAGGKAGAFTVATKVDDGNASNGVESGKAMQFNHGVLVDGATGTASTSTTYSLPTPVTDGIVNVSFDFYRSSNSPRVQFYFKSSIDRHLVSSPISESGKLGAHTVSGLSAIVPSDQWVKITYRINVYKQTFSVFVGDTEYTGNYAFRDPLSADLGKLEIFCDETYTNSNAKVQIDNLKFTTDVTNYHISVSGNGIVLNDDDKTMAQCPIGTDIETFLGSLTPSPAACVMEVYSADGTLKSGTDKLEKYDVVHVIYEDAGRAVKYTVIPDYSVDFTGIAVNGNEYYEASRILEPGLAAVRAKIINNTTEAQTFTVYGAAVGDKLHDVKLQRNITVPGESKKDIKFEINLPDKSSETKLKLILVDNTDGITPLGDAETSLIYTSQVTKMPNIFSDNMVLQRNEPVNVFGFAPTGTEIDVTFGEYTAEGTAADGKFCVQLPSMPADSTGKTLTVVAGDNTFTYNNVVVGEVLYGSGQSNMQMGVSSFKGAVNLGYVPNMRNFGVKSLFTTKDRVDGTVSESWNVVTEANWKGVGAVMHCVAYYLRELEAIPEDVVIGIVNASWGGTGIAMWSPAEILEKGPHSAYYESYLAETRDSKGIRNTDLYSAMAKSVVPYTAKAAVWYQGEHDAGVTTYNWYMDEFVKVMRKDFGKDIPYYAVQLPGYSTPSWSQFRLTQWKSHNPENGVHMVVTNDTGEIGDIHPQDKDAVGERIARHIAYHTYGIKDVPYQGPVFSYATANGNDVTINFDFVNDGLHGGLCSLASDNSLTCFEVSADGTTWHSANAQIKGDTIVVSSENVADPAYVRYGYIATPLKSAGTNTDGVMLPMAPFSEAIN